MKKYYLTITLLLASLCSFAQNFKAITVSSEITRVQPMTGIVFWTDSDYAETEDIQLEYSYMLYSDIVSQKDVYKWTKVDKLLTEVASRGHQAILRFRFEYPGENGGKTAVPDYIKNSAGYSEEYYKSEDGKCYYADWRSTELQSFTKEFYTKFAERYDNDPRLAFIQTGFGHWAEYHIYGGPKLNLGKNFPSKAYQEEFMKHMDAIFVNTPWSISIDAADEEYTPFAAKKELRDLNFGLFDDSFMSDEHEDYNKYNWETFGNDRYKTRVCGGEFSYYTDYDQKNVLNATGIHGVTWEQAAKQYYISYMIGNDQPDYQPMSRIKSAGMASGYKFKLIQFLASDTESKITLTNNGIAPIYYDAYVTVNGVRSSISLKGLCPGESKEYIISSGGENPILTIESDRLVKGQIIQFEGNKGSSSIDNNRAQESVNVYLNQSTQSLHFEGEINQILITDISGRIVFIKENINLNNVNIDFSSFNSGIYLVKTNDKVFKINKK